MNELEKADVRIKHVLEGEEPMIAVVFGDAEDAPAIMLPLAGAIDFARQLSESVRDALASMFVRGRVSFDAVKKPDVVRVMQHMAEAVGEEVDEDTKRKIMQRWDALSEKI